MAANQQNSETRLVGLLAQFNDPDGLLSAGEHARVDGGYTKLDAFSPFPVHGIDEALGIKRTILPFIVLFVALHALAGAIFLQWYTNAASSSPLFPGYDFRISGKPYWSLPAHMPVVFEIIVLSSAFASFFGMLILNMLPRLANPLHRIARFKRATNDRFFLVIQEKDPKFDLERTKQELVDWGADEIEEVREDMSDQKLPSFVKTVLLFLGIMMFVPPVLIYRARGLTSGAPRLHIVPDMDWQIKYEAQELGPETVVGKDPKYLFPHQRAALDQLAGTVARGEVVGDFEYMTGIVEGSEVPNPNAIPTSSMMSGVQDDQKNEQSQEGGSDGEGENQEPEVVEPEWLAKFPKNISVNSELMERGKNRFEIYCAVCHGYGGAGDGLVNKRALELAPLNKAVWTAAKSLHDETVVSQPVGRIYDTITHGRGTMGPYKDQITVEDRWAIVLYVKAIQETRKNETKPEPSAPQEETEKQSSDSKSDGEAGK